jgi:lactoylglutathione lyase
MAKLRHIALSVQDMAVARKFFEDAFDMKVVGPHNERAVHLTDGTIDVALLARQGQRRSGDEKSEPFFGIEHFGMWVDDIAAARRKAEAAGATYVAGSEGQPGMFYEIKYRDPLGNIFDLTSSGWAGAVKEVVPVAAPKTTVAAKN